MLVVTINNYMDTKKCKLCEEEKNLEYFYKFGKNYSSRCRKCHYEYQKNSPNRKENCKKCYEKNKEKRKEKRKERYYANIEKNREYTKNSMKKRRSENPEKYKEYAQSEKNKAYQKEYREKNKEKQKEYNKDYYLKNQNELKNYQKNYQKENKEIRRKRYKKDKEIPERKIRMILRSRFKAAVKKDCKNSSVIKLLGCSIDEFKIYLESKFQEGMTWENHGLKGWHIDHIIPCASFDLTKEEEQKRCFHYSNLQPLWWIDNLTKSNKVEGEPPPSTQPTTTKLSW